jgi:hypothetical protein
MWGAVPFIGRRMGRPIFATGRPSVFWNTTLLPHRHRQVTKIWLCLGIVFSLIRTNAWALLASSFPAPPGPGVFCKFGVKLAQGEREFFEIVFAQFAWRAFS